MPKPCCVLDLLPVTGSLLCTHSPHMMGEGAKAETYVLTDVAMVTLPTDVEPGSESWLSHSKSCMLTRWLTFKCKPICSWFKN